MTAATSGQNHASRRHVGLLAIAVLCSAAAGLHAQWLNYRLPGVPRTPDGKVSLTAPTPRAPDGKPDLSGTWLDGGGYFGNLAKDLPPDQILMLPWAEALVKENQTNLHKNDPMVGCLPPGVPRIDLGGSRGMPHPFKVVQTPALVVLLYETSTNQTFRQVFLDGRPLPSDPQPTWLGYSIGRWDGDALVVDTVGFNGRAWIDTGSGHPQTETARVTERFARRDFGHMDIEITVDDPKAYAKPWRARVPVDLLADSDLIETFCENEKDLGRMQRTPSSVTPR
jgi:hypothetical protein